MSKIKLLQESGTKEYRYTQEISQMVWVLSVGNARTLRDFHLQ